VADAVAADARKREGARRASVNFPGAATATAAEAAAMAEAMGKGSPKPKSPPVDNKGAHPNHMHFIHFNRPSSGNSVF
jgi:hypothetical protein